MTLHISFFVSSILSAYWNGAATYYRGLARALHGRGHRLRFFEPDAFERQAHRDFDELPWGEVTVYDPADRAQIGSCLQAARGSDFIVKASGVGVNDELLECEVATLADSRTGTIFWDVDTPATLGRLEGNADDPLRAVLGEYDYVLCYGGGDAACSRYLALGARRCAVIYNALDPSSHYPVARDQRFSGDLAFLGNRLPDREARVARFFFDPAKRLGERRFVLGGSGWDGMAASLPNLNYVGHVFTADHNAFNVTPKAVINISRDDMADAGYSPATRVFEAAGSGSCLITDGWEGIERFLQPDEEVLVAESGEDVVDFIEQVSPEQARRIGSRARQRMLDEHTYAHRAAELEALLAGAS